MAYPEWSDETLRKLADAEDGVGGVMAISPELLAKGNQQIGHCPGCICASCTHQGLFAFGDLGIPCTKCDKQAKEHSFT